MEKLVIPPRRPPSNGDRVMSNRTCGQHSHYSPGSDKVQDLWKCADLVRGKLLSGESDGTVYQILINVLRTLLLGASNLSMQLLAATTRREVNKAHSEGK